MMSMGKASQSKYPAPFSGHLTAEQDQRLKTLDGNTYKVWSCLNRLLDSRAVNAIGQYLGYTVRVSQANIAERVNLSVRSVRRCIHKMETAGILLAERPIFGCNRYRLMGYVRAIETPVVGEVRDSASGANPTAPSAAEILRFFEEDSRDPSRGQSCDPSAGQGCVPPNRPVLSDQSIADLSPPPPSTEEKTVDKGEKRERDFADLFYETVLGYALTESQTRRRVNRDCKRLISDIAKRVGNIEAAPDILVEAFSRVKRKVTPIWSFRIMSTGYGQQAIAEAIQAHLSDPMKRGLKDLSARTALNGATLTDTASDEGEPCSDAEKPETNVQKPSRAEVDAALLETWSDERWQKWADEMVVERQRVRQMMIDSGFHQKPLTDQELTAYRQELLAQRPLTDVQKLDWLKARVADQKATEDVEKEERRPHRSTEPPQQGGLRAASDDIVATLQSLPRSLGGLGMRSAASVGV